MYLFLAIYVLMSLANNRNIYLQSKPFVSSPECGSASGFCWFHPDVTAAIRKM